MPKREIVYATCEMTGYGGGWALAELVQFRTKRRGERVMRYRWRSTVGWTYGILQSFATIEGAMLRAEDYPFARNVQLVINPVNV